MPDLAQQLRAVIDDAALPVALDEIVNRRSRPTTKVRVLTAAAVVAAVIAVAGIVVTRSADHRRATVDVTNPATVTGWLQLPKGPIPPRAGHVMVWTGSRLLVS